MSIGEPKIENFFAQYKLRKYPKGQILIFNGDEAEHVYHLVKGRVKQYDVSYRGDEVILNIFKPPAFFPMSLAINRDPSGYIYETETDVEAHQIPATEIVAYVKTNPEALFDLLSRVYRGVDGIMGRMVHLMVSSARNRLIYELVLECHRFGDIQKDGSCLLNLNETALGARAGLSRETVNREVHKLKNEGFIEMHQNEIFIKDLPSLEKKLD